MRINSLFQIRKKKAQRSRCHPRLSRAGSAPSIGHLPAQRGAANPIHVSSTREADTRLDFVQRQKDGRINPARAHTLRHSGAAMLRAADVSHVCNAAEIYLTALTDVDRIWLRLCSVSNGSFGKFQSQERQDNRDEDNALPPGVMHHGDGIRHD